MSYAHIINPLLQVAEGKKAINNVTYGSKNSGYEYDMLSTDKSVIVDHLEFATDNPIDARVRIYTKVDGVEQLFRPVDKTGANLINFTAQEMSDNATDLISILEFNESSNIYKFAFREPLRFPEGCRVQVANTGANAVNVGCTLTGREL